MPLSEALPRTFQKLMVTKKSLNFREATSVTTESMPDLKPNEILVRNKYVGINASDILRSAGSFPTDKIPFEIGYEGVGTVVKVGSNVTKYKKNQHVSYVKYGAYSEYVVLSESSSSEIFDPVAIKELKPEYLAIAGVSGLTAKLALEKCGELKSGETVLVTAAAGGTGQFAVLFAKRKNCHVIGTCSTKEKALFLKSVGCDRVVITKEENLQDVLAKEYPKGVDVVFESIGGEMFNAALSSLAVGGRLIIIGFISGYKSGDVLDLDLKYLPRMLLSKSASVRGFFLQHYAQYANEFAKKLVQEYESDITIKIQMDNGQNSDKLFTGIESIIDAVEYLHAAKNCGKIYAKLY